MSPYDRLVALLAAQRLDRALAAGVPPSSSAALSLRASAITAPEKRRELAATLRRIAREEVGPGAFGVRLTARRPHGEAARTELERLAGRLAAPGPVEPRGVALALELLSDGTGPLFWERSSQDLGAKLRQALAALEPGATGGPRTGGAL